jgi:hypothetical protein
MSPNLKKFGPVVFLLLPENNGPYGPKFLNLTRNLTVLIYVYINNCSKIEHLELSEIN